MKRYKRIKNKQEGLVIKVIYSFLNNESPKQYKDAYTNMYLFSAIENHWDSVFESTKEKILKHKGYIVKDGEVLKYNPTLKKSFKVTDMNDNLVKNFLYSYLRV